jgi:hypothetical protein
MPLSASGAAVADHQAEDDVGGGAGLHDRPGSHRGEAGETQLFGRLRQADQGDGA